MKEGKEYADIYCDLVRIYEETRDVNRPAYTLQKMLEVHSLEDIKQAFGIVGYIKAKLFHDGRFWVENEKWIETIEVPEDCLEWGRHNPFCRPGGIDDIHTSHINNLVTEIRKYENTKRKVET